MPIAANSGHAQQLSYEALVRYEETIKPPFRRALKSGRVDLLPPPAEEPGRNDPLARAAAHGRALYDEAGARLLIPLRDEGRCLAVLAVHEVSAKQLTGEVGPFLASLVEAAMEAARLRQSRDLDPTSGLFIEPVLDEAMAGAISRLRPSLSRGRPALGAQHPGGVCLALVEVDALAALQERHGRRLADRALAVTAGRLREAAADSICLARLGNALAVLWSDDEGQPRQAAEEIMARLEGIRLETPQGPAWPLGLRLGAATISAADCRGLAVDLAAQQKARAQRALQTTRRAGAGALIFFEDIAERWGRLSQTLPLDKAIIDLGRADGLAQGQRFQALDQAGLARAELIVLDVAEDESVAQIVAVNQPTEPPRPGDALRLAPEADSQKAAANQAGPREEIVIGAQRLEAAVDQATGLLTRLSLAQALGLLCEQAQPMAAVLARIEGLEGVRQISGHLGAEALMRALAEEARLAFPPNAVLGRHAPDTLAALLPEQSVEQARDWAQQMTEAMRRRTERPVRAGAAAHPCPGWPASEILENALKALVHAGFLEPFAAVAFDAVSLNISGDMLFDQGLIAQAAAEYEKALLLDPNEPNVLNSLGVCHGQQGRPQQAMEYFQKAMDAQPDNFMAHFNMGCALMALDHLEQARRGLERALELSPGHADSLFQLGRLAQMQGRVLEAAELLQRAAKAPDCRRAVHRHLGEALAALGRADQAEACLKTAVKLLPRDAAALAGLAGLYLDRGANREIALSLASRAARLEPDQPRHQALLARAQQDLGRLEEAAATLRAAVEAWPEDPYLPLSLGRVLAAQGQADAARRQILRALELEPNLQEARAQLVALG